MRDPCQSHLQNPYGPIIEARMGPMLPKIGPMWISHLTPCGTHAKVICRTHLGPIMVAHMGPMLFQKGPTWASCLNPRGTHAKVICKTHMGPIMVVHLGPIMVAHVHRAHTVPERPHTAPYLNPLWHPCQCHLQKPSRPHNGCPLNAPY